MKKIKLSINIISSFNDTNFINLLKNQNQVECEINNTEYNQVFQTLANNKANIWKKKANITLIWTTPEIISSEFNKLLDKNIIDPKKIKDEVNYFCNCIKKIKKNSDFVLVTNWILKKPEEENIALSFSENSGIESSLNLMNQTLINDLGKEKKIHILNSNKWLANCGTANAYSLKSWYLMKTPFSNLFFKEALSDILNFYNSTKGLTKKLLVLDLDDTLWGGIVGEVGWKNLRIGGHDHIGEAFQDFQKQIKFLKNQGVILAVVSKNEESVAIEAIKNHPEMILSMEDFSAYRINWEDKAKNIIEIVKELNIGLQSTVFFDDSPFERARVKDMLNEVYVPDLPKDPSELSTFLSKLHCFDKLHITEEDKVRGDLYKSESKRKKLKDSFKSLSEWIETLELIINIESLQNKNLQRTLQLLNKTNQMNLSTRRLNENELAKWMNDKSNYLWTIRAKDKFGDYGIIGILSIAVKNNTAQLVDFILSCRVVGRCIEDVMIEFLKEFCSKNKFKKIVGVYKKTNKNSLCFSFLKKINLISEKEHSFQFYPTLKTENLKNIKVIKSTNREKNNVFKNILA